jgi:hypothetical protein
LLAWFEINEKLTKRVLQNFAATRAVNLKLEVWVVAALL